MTPNSVKPLYVTMNNASRYTEENNGNKYLTLVPADESRETLLKKYGEMWRKIKDLLIPINNNPDDFDEKYVKTKFN